MNFTITTSFFLANMCFSEWNQVHTFGEKGGTMMWLRKREHLLLVPFINRTSFFAYDLERMSGWPLRLKKDDTDVSIIAKFSDPVDLEAAKLPMRMYVKDEEIEEEETAEVVKDAEYWRNRKKRRQTYRRKSQVILEDSAPRSTSSSGASSGPVGMQFEGTLSNMSMADIAETGSSTMALSRNSEAAKPPFKYVLLQVIKKDVLDPSTQQSTVATEVNVIPVSEWYQFKKPSMNGQKFLDEIDEDFEIEQKRAKEKLKRDKNLGRAIERAERTGNGHSRDTDEGGQGGDRFDMPAIFGNVASKSLRKGGGAGVGKKAASGPESLRLLDENGMDLDEARAFDDYCKGDYEATRADDDEDAWGEQAVLEEQDAVQAGQAVYEKSDDELGGSDDDEDDEDEDEGSDEDGGGGGARSGFVDELVESSAKEFRAMSREAADKKRSRDHLSESAADDSGSDAGSQKGGGIARKKRTRFAEEGVAMTVASSTDVGDGSQASTDGTPTSPSSASAVTIGVCGEHNYPPTTSRVPISINQPILT